MKWILALVLTIILVPKFEPYVSDYVNNSFVSGIGLGIAVYIISLFILILLGRSLGRLFHTQAWVQWTKFLDFSLVFLKDMYFSYVFFQL